MINDAVGPKNEQFWRKMSRYAILLAIGSENLSSGLMSDFTLFLPL